METEQPKDVFFDTSTNQIYVGGKAIPEPPPQGLRDWFAGMALQGIYANETLNELDSDTCAKWAYAAADSMINARDL